MKVKKNSVEKLFSVKFLLVTISNSALLKICLRDIKDKRRNVRGFVPEESRGWLLKRRTVKEERVFYRRRCSAGY